jgi:hypothetical protein
MKVQTMLMDAGALEVVVRCTKCQQTTRFTALEWTDNLLDGCGHCGAKWVDAQDVADVRDALRHLQALIRLTEPGHLPFVLQFGGVKVIRDAA